jgi:alpha-tubulin suppressor-like RCC1 family protein
MRHVGVVLLIPLMLGCSDAVAPPSALSALEGVWDYTANRTLGSFAGTCSDTGTFTFTKAAGGWVGSVQSVTACGSGVTSSPDTGSILSGISTADHFAFLRSLHGATCADTAVAAAGDADSLSGTEHCPVYVATWHAVRGGPLASVEIVPASVFTVTGDRRTLDLVMRTAGGRRVFRRPVVWSSSRPEVATASLGDLRTISGGSTTISATVEGKTATTSVTVLAPTSLVAVAAGDAFTCGIGADQRPYCWGHVMASTIPVPVQSSPPLASIATSQESICGISIAHEAWCWGRNNSGQLGIGTTVDTASPARVQASGRTFTSVTSGGDHSCAIATDGSAWCWGANAQGQLGTGSLVSSLVPVAVVGGYVFTALSAGDSHTCGIVVGGALYCWGNNANGQLGDSTTANRSVPTLVQGSHLFQSVSSGFVHTCGVAVGGAAWCWGSNIAGQFGDGTTTSANYPVPAASGLALVSLSASLSYGCGVTTTGDIWCWGFKGNYTLGQLGYGGVPGSVVPVRVSGGLTWASVTTGVYLYSDETTNAGTAAQTCGVTTAGVTWCWGDNLIGQLGVGTRAESYVPVRVSGQP